MLDFRGQFYKDGKRKKLLLALHFCLQGDQPASFVKRYVGSPLLAFWWTLPCPLTNFDRFSIGTCWRESIHKRGKKNLDIITNINKSNNKDTDTITNINISGWWRKSILKKGISILPLHFAKLSSEQRNERIEYSSNRNFHLKEARGGSI